MKVLIAIDSSPSSDVLLAEVARRPWPADTQFSVLTVVDLFALPTALGASAPATEREQQAAGQLVASAAERLRSAALNVETLTTEGYPPSSIVECARQLDADFIVIGSHGHSGITRFLLGSVAQGVLRGADCSVEIVRASHRTGDGGMRILLATDGSTHSLAAARSVATRPWPSASRVRLVSAVRVIAPAMDPWYAAGQVVEQLLEEHTKAAQEYIDAVERVIRDAGLATERAVLVDNPKSAILDEAKEWEADLIVVGSHGRRGLDRLLLGSVSEAVAMHAHCSVDVIRQPAGLG